MPLKAAEEPLDGDRDGIGLRKLEVAEQGVEHRDGDDVLRRHLHGVLGRDVGVERVLQALEEHLEARPHDLVVAHQGADPVDVAPGDAGHVVGPLVPVDARAALLDELGLDGPLPALHREERQPELHACGYLSRLLVFRGLVALRVPALVGGVRNLLAPVPVSLLQQVELVHPGLDALVVGAQGLQDAPDVGEHLRVIQRLLGRHARRDKDRQDDVAEVLPLGLPHHAPDGLHHIHGGVLRVEEDDGVQVGHVDALGQAARVGEDAARALLNVAAQPRDVAGAHVGGHVAVNVAQLACQVVALLGGVAGIALGYPREGLHDGLRGLDGRAEAHGPAQRGRFGMEPVHVVHDQHVAQARGVGRGALAVVGQALPATDDLADVLGGKLGRVNPLVVAFGDVQRVLLHGEDDHLVVGQKALLHGLAELDLVGGGAIEGFVVHRGNGEVLHGALALRRLAVDTRRGGHVQAFVRAHVLVVVDPHEGRGLLHADAGQRVARGPVRLIAHDDVERGHAELLGAVDDVDGLVG